MSLIVVHNGEDYFLQTTLQANDLKLKLIAADFTPTDNTVIGDLTICSDGSYADATIDKTKWTVTGGTATYNETLSFTFAGANTVHGYAVTSLDGSTLYWCEKLTTPLTYTESGGSARIVPVIEAD